MLKLYTWTTPNGRKIAIMLEELGVPYDIEFVDIGKARQFEPDFLAISPNNKIPAIVDDDGRGGSFSIFESGAILAYLADKHGRFMAPVGLDRWKALEWLYWQVGGLGPMRGQAGFFAKFSAEKASLAIDRFVPEVGRLFRVLERRLIDAHYLAGDAFSVADIACYPWMAGATAMMSDVLGKQLAGKPALDRWLKTIGDRPGVRRGMAIAPPKAAEPAD